MVRFDKKKFIVMLCCEFTMLSSTCSLQQIHVPYDLVENNVKFLNHDVIEV